MVFRVTSLFHRRRSLAQAASHSYSQQQTCFVSNDYSSFVVFCRQDLLILGSFQVNSSSTCPARGLPVAMLQDAHDCDPNKISSMAVDEYSDVGTRISGEDPNLLG